jgi:hypothetical protein
MIPKKGPKKQGLRNLGEIAREILNAPPETEWKFKGGVWRLTDDKEEIECFLDRTGGGYVYGIALSRCRTCAGLLDIIFQVYPKTWVSEGNFCAMIAALEYLLHPQGTMCSWGVDRTRAS